MALYLKQNDQRSDLQKKIAAELQDRARQPKPGDLPDGVDDSQYIKGTKQTTSLAWVWVLIVVAALVAGIWLVNLAMNTQ
jgi:hypothetical protein